MTSALLATSSFLPGRGGIESYLAELCFELRPRVAVFAPSRRDGKAIPADLPYPTIGYEGRLQVPTSRVAEAIISAAGDVGASRVLFGTPWPLALLGPRLRRNGLRYASIVHGAEILVPGSLPLVRSRLAAALRGADLLLPVSNFTRLRLQRLTGPHGPPMALLRARVDAGRFTPRADGRGIRRRFGLGDRPVVLTFGRLVRRKGIHRLLGVAPHLAEHRPDVCIVVAGTGPEEARLRRAGAPLGDRIVFAGRVPEEDAAALYAAADVFVLPVADRWRGLDTEGLGVVLLEASACGVPCVTGRSGGTPEAVVDGVTGLVIDAHDDTALVEAIVTLLENKELAHRMGTAGREHVESQFAERPLPSTLLEWLSAA